MMVCYCDLCGKELRGMRKSIATNDLRLKESGGIDLVCDELCEDCKRKIGDFVRGLRNVKNGGSM